MMNNIIDVLFYDVMIIIIMFLDQNEYNILLWFSPRDRKRGFYADVFR
jgi:hypothetical protein